MILRKELKIAYAKFSLLGLLLLVVDSLSQWSICIFYNYTGIPCPTCGLTRSFASLVKFDFGQAWQYHPLFVIVILFPYIYVQKSNKLLVITLALFIIVWLIRLYLFFPNLPPMVVNESAVLYKLLK